jgi:hypothetical protein
MSTPLATIFHGDVTLEQGSDVTQFGWGDININRRCIIQGIENSTTNTDGALIVAGGVGIAKTLNVHENLNILYGITNLTETHINTNDGPFTVTGANTATVQVGDSATFSSTGGNVRVISEIASLQLYGGLNSSRAVDIIASDINGGISLLSGTNGGGISVVSGSGGITETTSNGNVLITANNGSAAFSVNTQSANQDLTINLNGYTDSQLKIISGGNNTTQTALFINTEHTNGNIQISNANGLGNGSISHLTGSGGYTVVTNTSGQILMTSRGAGSSYIVDSSGYNQNMIIGLDNFTDSSLILKSSGTNILNTALQIQTTSSTGNILIDQPEFSVGKVSINTGMSGLETTTQNGGSTVITTNGASSTFTNSTTADNQDLNITVTGNTNSKVNITSSGTNSDAIYISTSIGGIRLDSNSGVQIESADVTNGIQIARQTSNIPVHIGTATSTTTIHGNLDVKGTTTTIESTVVTIDDNIVIVNNAPSGTGNGGLAVKRYQSANDNSQGDVISDTPDHSGLVQNGNNTFTTIHLSSTASNVDDYYAGWWVRITSGTGQAQVRRIKSYSGSTRIATIYSTLDQTTVLSNPTPIEGMDFSTIPDNTSNYSLYPCEFVMMIWDEAYDEFAFVCSNLDPATNSSFVHYSDLHIQDLVANDITVNNINGSPADITTVVNLNNNSTTPVTITDFPNIYGVYIVFVKPLEDNSRAHAVFTIGRVNAIGIHGTSVRIMSVKGVYNDQLDMQWSQNGLPQIMYRPYPNGVGGTTNFKLKIVSL